MTLDKRLVYIFIAVFAIVVIRLMLEEDIGNLVYLLVAGIPLITELYGQCEKDDDDGT